jgi:hypothetical protein
MKRIVRLTESDLTRIVKRVIMEQVSSTGAVAVWKTESTGPVQFYFTKELIDSKTKTKIVHFSGTADPSSQLKGTKFAAHINCGNNVITMYRNGQPMAYGDGKNIGGPIKTEVDNAFRNAISKYCKK